MTVIWSFYTALTLTVSSLCESRLRSRSKSLSFSLMLSCSRWISFSFSSTATNFSSSAFCSHARTQTKTLIIISCRLRGCYWRTLPVRQCLFIRRKWEQHLQSLLLFPQLLSELGQHYITSCWTSILLQILHHAHVVLKERKKRARERERERKDINTA